MFRLILFIFKNRIRLFYVSLIQFIGELRLLTFFHLYSSVEKIIRAEIYKNMTSHTDRHFQAAIFDMDGVLTQTVKLHIKAWTETFNEFLQKTDGANYKPLTIQDYKLYIDGVPRLEGIRNFLTSREISLPEGGPDEDIQLDTIFRLGERKNDFFLELVKKEGVEAYSDTIEMAKFWKSKGIKLALISSSKNCKHIIESAGIEDLFEVRVDGITSVEENLKGKPHPDIFLRANELMGVDKSQTIVIEDAILGVKAGKKGGFSLVVGVARDGEEDALYEAGADIVVKKLTELKGKNMMPKQGKKPEDLSNAMESIDDVFKVIGNKKPVLFLDYDGTLSPIVSNPEDAILSNITKNVIEKLSKLIPIGIISGRDRQNVESKIGIDSLIYAGSHGFDITGPNNLEMQYEEGQEALPILDEAELQLNKSLNGIQGALVERKKYAIAVHFRNVEEGKVKEVEEKVMEVLGRHKKLKKGSGKMIIELKPAQDWHKGKALTWILDALQLGSENHIPIFIGDDVTDEDALKVIEKDGIGIIVGKHEEDTAASYSLRDTEEVALFLEILEGKLKEL